MTDKNDRYWKSLPVCSDGNYHGGDAEKILITKKSIGEEYIGDQLFKQLGHGYYCIRETTLAELRDDLKNLKKRYEKLRRVYSDIERIE